MRNCWVNHFKCPGKSDSQDGGRTSRAYRAQTVLSDHVTEANPSAPQFNIIQFRLKEEAGSHPLWSNQVHK